MDNKRRVVITSNRLPVTLSKGEDGKVMVKSSSGGLATALGSVHGTPDSTSVWIGWPGPEEVASDELKSMLDPLRLVGVELTAAEVQAYYKNFSNGVLWPLCHYLLDKLTVEDAQEDWIVYHNVNQKFADVIVDYAKEDDVIWIHDYQLMLVPSMVRLRLPSARIGYFHHIPFPSADVFKTLPWRRQILDGLCGANLVGFHTANDAHNFMYSCATLLALETNAEGLVVDGRQVHVGAFPIGIDAESFAKRAVSAEVALRVAEIKNEAQGRKIMLSVDRLDYTKGIGRRLLSIERLLHDHPELKKEIHVIQVAVPSREDVEQYVIERETINELVGSVNGKYADPMHAVVHLLHRSISPVELSALYVAADVMLVTPVRDGMNLVCKEYVASRPDNSGVLILSEFAGAAIQLRTALQVNPYDLGEMAHQMYAALNMSPAEQEQRMAELKRIVFEGNVGAWADSFVDALQRCENLPRIVDLPVDTEISKLIKSQHLLLLLDYDGTLVDICKNPADAVPKPESIEILRKLCSRKGTQVHIVSGRPRGFLMRYLGNVHEKLALHAEHGAFSRLAGSSEWQVHGKTDLSWMDDVQEIMRSFVRNTDGAFLEQKSISIAFHFRATEPQLADRQVQKLVARLNALLPEERGFELLFGSKVLEARVRGMSKALPLPMILNHFPAGGAMVAIGDDVTDEDLFFALPPSAITIHVGAGSTRARFRLPHVRAVWALLRNIAEEAPTPSFTKKQLQPEAATRPQ